MHGLESHGLISTIVSVSEFIRVESGHFENQLNSDIHLQTVESQMRRLLISRLIRNCTVCIINLFFIPIFKI